MSIFEISKENSLRFFRNRLVNELKNDNNTLSLENLNMFPYIDIQNYISKDIITTQFKSGYSEHLSILTFDSGYTNLPVVKITENRGKKYSLDGHYYNYNNTSTAIYFTSGNVYDYDDITIPITITNTHNLNGYLPEFAIIGQVVEIVGLGSFVIQRIIYDETKDANLIIVNNVYAGAETTAIIKSLYDLLPYEVYETTIDFSSYSGNCYLTIKASKLYERTIIAQSEMIYVQASHPNTLEIIYYNNNNGDILYSSGIKNKIRLPYFKIEPSSENTNTVTITDETSILVDSNIYDKNKFYFKEVSNEILLKSKIALSSDVVIINQEGYVVNGTFNTEVYNNTNLSAFNVVMAKTGKNYYEDASLLAALAYKARSEALGCTTDDFNLVLETFDLHYESANINNVSSLYNDESLSAALRYKARSEALGCTTDDFNLVLNSFKNNY